MFSWNLDLLRETPPRGSSIPTLYFFAYIILYSYFSFNLFRRSHSKFSDFIPKFALRNRGWWDQENIWEINPDWLFARLIR